VLNGWNGWIEAMGGEERETGNLCLRRGDREDAMRPDLVTEYSRCLMADQFLGACC
jgi:hypothetical protein